MITAELMKRQTQANWRLSEISRLSKKVHCPPTSLFSMNPLLLFVFLLVYSAGNKRTFKKGFLLLLILLANKINVLLLRLVFTRKAVYESHKFGFSPKLSFELLSLHTHAIINNLGDHHHYKSCFSYHFPPLFLLLTSH